MRYFGLCLFFYGALMPRQVRAQLKTDSVYELNKVLGLSYAFGTDYRFSGLSIIHPIDTNYQIDRGESQIPLHGFSLYYSREFYGWLSLSTEISYREGRSEVIGVPNDNYRYLNGVENQIQAWGYFRKQFFSFSGMMAFDLLYKDPYQALRVKLGLEASYFRRIDYLSEYRLPDDVLMNRLTYERSDRLLRPLIGLELEEFITSKWGFRFTAFVFPTYQFKPERVSVEDVYLNFAEGEDYILRQGGLVNGEPYQEVLQMAGGYLQLGFFIRL